MDRHPISEKEMKAHEIINYFFTISFFLEMVIKIPGLGIRAYIRD
jgi:hypothetical protein